MHCFFSQALEAGALSRATAERMSAEDERERLQVGGVLSVSVCVRVVHPYCPPPPYLLSPPPL